MANWLITPTFSTVTAGTVTFWIRGDDFPGFEDQVAFGFSNGSDATADFTLLGSQVVAVGCMESDHWCRFRQERRVQSGASQLNTLGHKIRQCISVWTR